MPLNILISGSGIAGTVLAYFLVQAGHKVAIIERDSCLRQAGQSIDIRGSAIEIIDRMGLKSAVDAARTPEKGLKFVDTYGKDWAIFPTTGRGHQQSFSSEYEVLRGELATIFANAVTDKVEWLFNDTIDTITQHDSSVEVTFTSSNPPRTFDLLVGADGLRSSTRAKTFSTTPTADLNSMGAFAAYFTIPTDLLHSDLATWYPGSRGRLILLRPGHSGDNTTRVTLIKQTHRTTSEIEKWRALLRRGRSDFMATIATEYEDAGYIAPAIISGMKASSDFYCGEIAQVKTSSLHKGRVVLVGDAAFGAWTLTGMGTSLAIIGAYVLAGEINDGGEDLEGAFERYERIMLPYADEVRDVQPWLPRIVYPQREWEVAVFLFFLWVITALDLKRWLRGGSSAFMADAFELPEYKGQGRRDSAVADEKEKFD